MEEPVFDFEHSLRRFDGDRELYGDLIAFFLEDSPKLLEQLRQGLQRGDAKSVRHAAHTLKGLTANFTARRAVDAADAVERLAQGHSLTSAHDAVARLERETTLLDQALRGLRDTLGGAPRGADAPASAHGHWED
jgi:HPt (histidine-containing phosphotransfer) domain-containing protein